MSKARNALSSVFKKLVGKAEEIEPAPKAGTLMPAASNLITLGYEVKDGSPPVTIERQKLANGHVHIRGRTRSGKTSLAILPLIEQLVLDYPGRDGTPTRDPIFVFDLGGDQAFFHLVKELAESQHPPRKFRFMSLERDDAWDYFDPFQAVTRGENRTSVIRIANMLIEAFNLDNGLIYGGSYFTQQNLAALLRVARQLFREEGRQPTLADITEYLDKPVNRKANRDADQVRMVFHFLTEYEQLMPDERTDPNRKINMDHALGESEVIYFYTPTLNEATTARQIAGLGLYSLINAAIQRRRRGAPMRRAWVFVDEFQELAGRSFAALLAQAGKYGITLVMANQTTSQLETRDTSLASVVFDNTHVKQYFTVTSWEDRRCLEDLSETEERILEGGYSYRANNGTTMNARIMLEPTLKHNEILATSGRFGESFLVIDDGSGHRNPIRVFRKHKQGDSVNEEMSNKPLPEEKKPPRPVRLPKPVAKTKKKPTVEAEPISDFVKPAQREPSRQEPLGELIGQKRKAEGRAD